MRLLDFFLRKQRMIEAAMFEYLDEWEKCLGGFKSSMDIYFEKGTGEEFDYWVEATHKLESKADDTRRRIEWEMYSKALLPESRGDMLGLLETMDRIPNKAESIIFMIQTQNLKLPEELKPGLKRIVALSCDAMEMVYEAAGRLIRHEGGIMQFAEKIDHKESECDHAERDIIRNIFEMPIEGSQKILLKELVIELGTLTDRAENVSDRLTILSVKRRV